jgi:hypothetical protein
MRPERDLSIEACIRMAENRAVSAYLGQITDPVVLKAMSAEAIRDLKAQIDSGLWSGYGCRSSKDFAHLRCTVVVQTSPPQISFRWDFKDTPLQFLCTWNEVAPSKG